MKKDITGMRFDRLLVVELTDRKSGSSPVWKCLCDCGTFCEVSENNLKRFMQKSCGCFRRDFCRTHGLSRSRIYTLWSAMVSRVKYKSKNHGARGISYDPKWSTFEGFYQDMSESYADTLELDRIDVDGDYCKDNCRWVDKSIQAFNKRMDTRNKSGRTGVYYLEEKQKWTSRITKFKKCIRLGVFDTFDEAVKAREDAELKYFGFIKQ